MNLKTIPVLLVAMTVAAPAMAAGPFVAVKLNRAFVDASIPSDPGVVDTDRTRGAVVLGYQFHNRVELAVEHWSGSTGLAECRPTTAPCPAIAIPTHGRFTSGTIGYEFVPYAGAFALGVRAGIEHGRLSFGDFATRSRTSPIAGATARYLLNETFSVGLDASASGFETRTVGLELRARF